jgi:RHS repeat-associated protein
MLFTTIKVNSKKIKSFLFKICLLIFIGLFFIVNPIFSQNIVQAEYFVNTDPGYGNGTQISLSPSQNITNLNFEVNISSLSIGFNNLYVRVKDDSARWSITNVKSFYKEQIYSSLQNISNVEYFIDTDPGFGSGTNISVAPDTNIDSISFLADISTLTLGFHTLIIRAKDQNGKWSQLSQKSFYKENIYPNAQLITKAEYFIDTDPGNGNALNIPLSSDSILSNISFIADISNLGVGFHSIFIRTKDQNAKWSLTNVRSFYKEQLILILPNIVKAEYYLDSDPGFGNGLNISINSDSIITGITFLADLSGNTNGFHTLNLRVKDQNGKWSQTNIRNFYKENINANLPNIVIAEYFLNTDPGLGNGISIPLVADTQITNLSFIADISSLADGFNELYIRVKDQNGLWSITNVHNFYKETRLASLQNITQLEYFIDSDPGKGNGEQVTIVSDSIFSILFEINMQGLTQGSHYLFIRAKDQSGKWSIVNKKDFYIDKKITLIANPANKGVLTGDGFYPSGYALTISATPITGYTFVNWTEGGSQVSAANNYSFSVTTNRTLTANFNLIYYSLNYIAGANGSISGSTSQSVGHGNNGTQVQAIPSTGYHFVDWSDGSLQNPRIDSNITGNISVTANFAINTYTLNYNAGNYGILSGDSNQVVNYNSNGSAVQIFPFAGYQFINWSDANSNNPRQEMSVASNFDVTANYAYSTFSLLTPLNSSSVNTDTIQFTWTEVFNARYELLVDNKSDFTSPEISKKNISCLSNLTSNNYTICANWLFEGTYYWKVIAIVGNDTLNSPIWSFDYSPPKQASPQWVPFYRAFNSSDVDHFYCSSESHINQAITGNYKFEGVEGYVGLHPFQVSGSDSLRPIYRFYSPSSFTGKAKSHFYSSDSYQRDSLIEENWIYEGISGYGINNLHTAYKKLYHTALNQTNPDIRKDHFYTTSEVEKNSSIAKYGYQDQGFICYIFTNKDTCGFGPGLNPCNGNFGDYSKTVFSIPEGKISLDFIHFYNSGAVRKTASLTNPIGVGRTHNYDISIVKDDDRIFVLWGDFVSEYNAQTLQCQTKGSYDELIKQSSTNYQIKKNNQTIYNFDCLPSINTNDILFLTSITDRYGNTLSLEYFDDGKLKRVKSPSNRYISYTYYSDYDENKYGLIKFVKDSLALNRVVEFRYDNNRNLIQYIDAKSQSTYYAYNEEYPQDHFLISISYADGTKLTNTYDYASKRLISQNYIKNDISKLTTVTIPVNNEVTIKDENNIETIVEYDSLGNSIKESSGSLSTYYEYSDNVNPRLPTKITDKMGNKITYTYNSKGNPTAIYKPEGIVEQYQWNSNNDVITYTSPLNKTTTFNYTNGYLTSIQQPFGNSTSTTTSFTYFPNGNVKTISKPLNQTTIFTYDGYNNLETETDNLNHTTTYEYDNASRVIAKKDENNHTTTYGYDNNDLMTFSLDPMNNLISYYYNENDKLTSVKDAKNHSTSINYNGNTGLIQSVTDQLNHSTNFTYFDNGLLKSQIDRKNQTINYTYDTLMRLKNLTATGLSRSFSYNNNSSIIQATYNNGSQSFAYDSLNRLILYTDPNSNQIGYEYDKANNLKKIIYPGNKIVSYNYYDDNALKSVEDWKNNTTFYSYNNDGSLKQVDNPNGTYTKYTYDIAGRLVGLQNLKSDSSIINSYNYTLDSVGNHVEVVQYEPYAIIPVYLGGQSNYNFSTYDNANRIQSCDNSTFSHDANGNMTQKNEDGVITNYVYDIENRLTSVNGLLTANYTYDAFGNRIGSTINGTSKKYVLDISGKLSNILIESDNSNNPIYYYIYGNGLQYRIRASDDSVQYYHYDFRGSTIAITNENQIITHQYAYDAFGKVIQSQEVDFNPFQFVGKYGVMYDDSALLFMRARYYNPQIARFLTEDPIWNVNLYSYAGNNAVMNIDPSGEASFGIGSLDFLGVFGSYSRDLTYYNRYSEIGMYANILNLEPVHEHIFFSDGTNVGFGGDGKLFRGENILNYHVSSKDFDDLRLKQAIINVYRRRKGKYNITTYNCQHFAFFVRMEYHLLYFSYNKNQKGIIEKEYGALFNE